jgi:hypothetical protein
MHGSKSKYCYWVRKSFVTKCCKCQNQHLNEYFWIQTTSITAIIWT